MVAPNMQVPQHFERIDHLSRFRRDRVTFNRPHRIETTGFEIAVVLGDLPEKKQGFVTQRKQRPTESGENNELIREQAERCLMLVERALKQTA